MPARRSTSLCDLCASSDCIVGDYRLPIKGQFGAYKPKVSSVAILTYPQAALRIPWAPINFRTEARTRIAGTTMRYHNRTSTSHEVIDDNSSSEPVPASRYIALNFRAGQGLPPNRIEQVRSDPHRW